jgi:NAD(P)H-dependent FMN reductase
MSILTISGSAQKASSNRRLLSAIAKAIPDQVFVPFEGLTMLPLFSPDLNVNPLPPMVINWQKAIRQAEALIVATPEYIHNIPGVLKNALEWVTSSGELSGKPVLAITFTPHPPRGERAMQSLLWSLEALDARIVAQLPLYQTEIKKTGVDFDWSDEQLEMLTEAVKLLVK